MVIATSIAIPFAAGAAGITQITFTSPPQTIEPSVASARITIEVEDAAGEAVRGSTVCLVVTSSSPTGEFSTNVDSWNAEPLRKLALTISSNQYRRNFYYLDSAEGVITLTANAALRPSGSTCTAWKGTPVWSASQQITIDKNAAALAAAHAAQLAAASAPKTEVKSGAPTAKKKATKFVSKTVSGDSVEQASADSPLGAEASAPQTEGSQVAAAGLFPDSLWWVAVLGLVGAGCVAVVLSRKHANKEEDAAKEWNIAEEQS